MGELMEQYEAEKWYEEIRECFLGTGDQGKIETWEGIISNLGIFFQRHARADITKLLWEFVCHHGQFTQMAAFNLSSYYLSVAKWYTTYGVSAKCPPPDFSLVKELRPGMYYPDVIGQELLKRKDLLEKVD